MKTTTLVEKSDVRRVSVDWEAEIEKLARETAGPKKAPDGWLTACQWRERINKGETSTKKWIRAQLENGSLERQMFMVTTTDGRALPTPHYRPKLNGS